MGTALIQITLSSNSVEVVAGPVRLLDIHLDTAQPQPTTREAPLPAVLPTVPEQSTWIGWLCSKGTQAWCTWYASQNLAAPR